MKTIHDHAEKQQGQTVISYFFNARAPDPLEKSPLGMYRSLTHQLLESFPYLDDRFVELFHGKEKQGKVDDWTIIELQNFLTHIAKTLGQRALTVLVDALDEGEENDVRQMIELLGDLSQTSIDHGTLIKICLSSRHYPHTTINRGVEFTVEGQPGHNRDIALYVNTRLKGNGDPQLKGLEKMICRKASGIFLWVELVVRILNTLYDHGQVDTMIRRLDEIPRGLDELLKEILMKDAEVEQSSILLLQWVLFARKDLSPAALYFAVKAGSESSGEWNPLAIPPVPDEHTLRKYILSNSKGLVEVSASEPPTVQFIHETIRDFLLKNNQLAELEPALGENLFGLSHDQLQRCCFRYFSKLTTGPQSGYTPYAKLEREREEIFCDLPFMEYAVGQIFAHAETADRAKVPQKYFLDKFGKDDRVTLKKWIRIYNLIELKDRYRYGAMIKTGNYTLDATLGYILSESNSTNLISILMEDGADVNVEGEKYGNALQAACVCGHEQTVRLLIEGPPERKVSSVGRDPSPSVATISWKNMFLKQFRQNDSAAQLTRGYKNPTSVKGRLSGEKAITRTRANVNAPGGLYRNTLQAAIIRGNERVVQILLDHGAEINAPDGSHWNALQAAAERGHKRVAEMLLDRGAGASIDVRGGIKNKNAMEEALEMGYEDIAQLLRNYQKRESLG